MARLKVKNPETGEWFYADLAIQDDTTKESVSNKVTSLSSSSTDTEYPSAKCVYDELQSIPSMPSGTNTGDILVWDGDEWVSKPKWQMIYQPVEYAEATGTQRINTGVAFSGDLKVEIDCQFTDTASSSTAYIMGVRDWGSGSTKRAVTFGIPMNPSSFGFNCAYPEGDWTRTGSKDTDRHLWYMESGSQKIDNVEAATGSYSTGADGTIDFTLYVRHQKGTGGNEYDSYSKAKIYRAKFWNGSTLIRDLIPVQNLITGNGAFFDLVEAKAYENTGTGYLIAGSPVII